MAIYSTNTFLAPDYVNTIPVPLSHALGFYYSIQTSLNLEYVKVVQCFNFITLFSSSALLLYWFESIKLLQLQLVSCHIF